MIIAAVPLNETTEALSRPVPEIVTVVPTAPLTGEKPVTAGTGTTVKLLAVDAFPPVVDTVITPVVAPSGTVAETDVAEITEKAAATPLNVTATVPARPVPVIVTGFKPTIPLVGAKLVMVGVTVKFVVLRTKPPAVVTVIGPVIAVAGTTATICVDVSLVTVPRTPPNVTVAPVRLVPVIVTLVPVGPLSGEKPLLASIVGLTRKVLALVAEPNGVVTMIRPDVAPGGTTATIWLAISLVMLAETPLNVTLVAPARPVPLMVTEEPIGPLSGAKPVIVGAGTTVKLIGLVGEPKAVVAVTTPVAAPVGTVAVICVSFMIEKLAATPLKKLTAVVVDRPVPVIVTVVPTGPLTGERPAIVDGATTVKLDGLVATPPAVVTVNVPVVAPIGTVATIWDAVSVVMIAGVPVPANITAVAADKLLP